MALPNNELTKKAAEELIKQWLDKESKGLFSERFLQELYMVHVVHPKVACIPIIPPGQEEDPPSPPSEGLSESHREGFFEKRIKRVDSGGPPPRGKPKPVLAEPDPTNTVEKWRQTEAIHRAISVRPR